MIFFLPATKPVLPINHDHEQMQLVRSTYRIFLEHRRKIVIYRPYTHRVGSQTHHSSLADASENKNRT